MNIVISGASKGIGKSIAEAFASEAKQMILCARNNHTLEETASKLRSINPQLKIHTLSADLSKKNEAQSFGTFCNERGATDILVNNAGTFLPGLLLEQEEEAMETMMDTNFYSAFYLTKALLPKMIEKKTGHIFNICSVAALKAYDNGGGYSVSKFAMDGLSKNLRHELKGKGVKVTTVYPGAVLTDSWGDFDNSDSRIMEATDISKMVFAASKLSMQAVVESIIIRPQLGDL